MEEIKKFFKVGSINFKHGPQSIQFRVQSIKELKVIIEHFDKYPLITQKSQDFKMFQKVYSIKKSGQHLTNDGLQKIVALKATMNLGLSEKLQAAFPDVVRVERPLVELSQTIDPHWLAGIHRWWGFVHY